MNFIPSYKTVFALFFLLLATAFAYTDVGGGTCYCYASPLSDCQDALSSSSCSYVYLNESVNISVRDPYYILLSGSNYSNKVFDCQGNLINNTYIYKQYGIAFDSLSNWTIKNCVITNMIVAISASSINNCTFSNLTLENNSYSGLVISGNPSASGANTVTDSVVRENGYYDLWIGSSDPFICNDILSNVTGSGNRPIVFVNNQSSLSNMHVSELIFCNASNSVLSNVTVNGSDTLNNNGIAVYFSNGVNGTGIRSSKNLYGIHLEYSNFTNFSGFTLDSNGYAGIYADFSSNNSFDSGTISGNGGEGVAISSSVGNSVRNASVLNNYYYGIILYNNGGPGFTFQNRFSNLTVAENRIYDISPGLGDPVLCANTFEDIFSTAGRPILFFNSTTTLADVSVSELILCNASNSVLSNVTVDGSASLYNNALFLISSSNLSVTNVNSSNNFYGIYIYAVNRSSISNITAQENSEYDIYMEPQTGSAMCTNNITNAVGSGNRPILYFNYPFSLSNAHLSELILCNSNGSSVTNVTVNGSQTFKNNAFMIFYSDLVNVTGAQSVHNYVGLWAYLLSNSTLRNITLLNNRNNGMDASALVNCNISDVLASYNGYNGVYMYGGSSIVMSNIVSSHHTAQSSQGVYFSCSGCTLGNVTTLNNSYAGIYVNGNDVNVTNFNATNSSVGIFANGYNLHLSNGIAWGNSNDGVWLSYTTYSMFSNITSTGNPYGFMIGVSYSSLMSYSNITNCTITNNSLYGMYLQNSTNFLIYNNYFNNTNNAFSTEAANNWSIARCSGGAHGNIAYPAAPACLGGNLWSDYVGIDTNGDYISETNLPYAIGGSGSDWLPLVRSDMVDVMNITLIAPPNGTYFNDTVPWMVPLTWLAINDKSSSLLCNVTVNGALINSSLAITNNSAYTLNATFTVESIYNWNVTCWSPLNSSGTSSTWRFGIDVTAPTGQNGSSNITLIAPLDGSGFNVTTLNFSWYAQDNVATVLKCDYYMDGALVLANVNSTNATVTNITRTGLAQGNHSWNVSCRDDANNSAYSPIWHFMIDTEAPQGNGSSNITLIAPPDYSIWNVSSINFSWYAQDNLAPVLMCDYYYDGVLTDANISSINGTVTTFARTGLAQGNHTWYVSCRDSANTARSDTWHLFIDTEPPTGQFTSDITLIAPPNNSFFNATDAVVLSWYVRDNLATRLNCDVYLNGLLNTSDLSVLNGTTTNFGIAKEGGLPEGFYNWSVTCRDDANNSAHSQVWYFTVDTHSPTGQNGSENVTLFTPPDYSMWNTSILNFSWYVEDNIAPTMNCSFYLDDVFRISMPSPNATITSTWWDVASYRLAFESIFDGPGNDGDDHGYWAVPTTDGGYMLAGDTDTGTKLRYVDAWMVKTDENGSSEWNATYGGPTFDWARSVVQTTDGGYAAVGTKAVSGAGVVWLFKTYANGTLEWETTFGESENSSGYFVQQTSDGGYIIAASKQPSSKFPVFSVWVIKTDSMGNAVWNSTFWGDQPTGPSGIPYTVRQTTDGGYVVSAAVLFPTTSQDMAVLKLNSTGAEEWNSTFGGLANLNDGAFDARQTSDGGYVAAGYGERFFFGDLDWRVAKLDASGAVIWNRQYHLGGFEDSAKSIVEKPDGKGFIAVGYVTDSLGAKSLAIIGLDNSGNELWNTFVAGPDLQTEPNSIEIAPGGYILSGTRTTTSGKTSMVDAWMAKLIPENAEGAHTWQMICLDNASNPASSPVWHFTIDFPDAGDSQITLISPPNGSHVDAARQLLTWRVTDDYSETMNCTVYLNGTGLFNVLAGNNTDIYTQTPVLTPGDYYWNVTCQDEAGNSNHSATWMFTFNRGGGCTGSCCNSYCGDGRCDAQCGEDNATCQQDCGGQNNPPTVVLVKPLDGASIPTNSVVLNFTSSDDHTYMMNCTMLVSNGASQQSYLLSAINNAITSKPLSGLGYGTYLWNVSCVDGNGAAGRSQNWQFSVTCGNGVCDANAGETCSNCAADCGACRDVCGDGNLTGGEQCEIGIGCTDPNKLCNLTTCTCYAKPPASTCGDGICSETENCTTCEWDCGKCPQCTRDSDCKQGEMCSSGQCVQGVGCQYGHPPCGECSMCSNNQCIDISDAVHISAPLEAPVNTTVTVILYNSTNGTVAGSYITVTGPDGVNTNYYTDSAGTVYYVPDKVGYYVYSVPCDKLNLTRMVITSVYDPNAAPGMRKLVIDLYVTEPSLMTMGVVEIGKPVNGAEVDVLDPAKASRNGATDAAGSYKDTLVTPGKYVITVSANNVKSLAATIDLSPLPASIISGPDYMLLLLLILLLIIILIGYLLRDKLLPLISGKKKYGQQ